jgi:YegS/Rv2252/BmrU family lipid kinase
MKRILLLVNPYAGTGDNLKNLELIKSKLTNWKIEVLISQYKNHFEDYLTKNQLNDFDSIGVIGGDGTMHDIVNGLKDKIDSTPPIILFPCGTGNSFNHDINCFDIETAIQRLNLGKVQEIDIYKLTQIEDNATILFFNIVGWGLVTEINSFAEKLRWFGGMRYNIASIIKIFSNPKFKAIVEVENKELKADFTFILACNTKHTGKAMKIAPLAELSDGLLDILIVKHIPFYQLLKLFPLIFSGKHINSPLLQYIKTSKIIVKSLPLELNIDGEIKSKAPFSLELYNQKLKMIV